MTMVVRKTAVAAAKNLLLLLLLLGTAGGSVTTTMAAVNMPPPPSTGQDWISIDEGIEFQPASSSTTSAAANDKEQDRNKLLRQVQDRFLAEQTSSASSHQQNVMYVDSKETYYDGYAQAWRYVGFYTDCSPNQNYDYDERRRRRNLNSADDEEYPCIRYLLWAAYVDLSYSGLGIGEYQFYDTYKKKWDTSACETIGNGISDMIDEETGVETQHVDTSICKKMDCHLSSTSTWQLLGYFKEYQYTDWFEQLFKHEGYCIWQNNEYNFMYSNYYAWPQYGCTATETTLSDGTLLYYDTKAIGNANMTYGLFTDSKCSKDYQGDEVTMESVLLNNNDGGSGDEDDGTLLSLSYLDKWNAAMEIYKVCQPCRAYSLQSKSKNNNNNNNNNNDDYDPNNGLFQCYDAAGYTNVNQCMKFRTKTYMSYATLEQVMEAAQQGGVTSISVHGRTYGSYMSGIVQDEDLPNWELLYTGFAVLALGMSMLMAAMIWTKRCKSGGSVASLNEPLI